MKTLINKILAVVLFLIITRPAFAADLTVHFFWSQGCPHCAKEKVFLESLKNKYPQVLIKDYEISQNRENINLLQKAGKELNTDVSGVPFTVIGDKHFTGYYNDETTGKEIEEAIKCALENGCSDLITNIDKPKNETSPPIENLNVPILGNVNIKNISLPALTFLIAIMDGFNPCAMWTLLFLISLLLGMEDRKRMWILGIAFIAASAFVYFLFLSAWLNFFLFLGYVFFVRIAIGLIALFAGSYNIRDYFVNKKGGCSVMGDEKRQKVFEKIKDVTQKKNFFIALGGIVMLAIAVNMIELVCSAGLPAIYTQILSLSKLSNIQYYLYLLFYIIIFMLDDLFVFFTAMITLQATGIQSKYSRLSRLVGGILMLAIGLLLLFKPDVLMFG